MLGVVFIFVKMCCWKCCCWCLLRICGNKTLPQFAQFAQFGEMFIFRFYWRLLFDLLSFCAVDLSKIAEQQKHLPCLELDCCCPSRLNGVPAWNVTAVSTVCMAANSWVIATPPNYLHTCQSVCRRHCPPVFFSLLSLNFSFTTSLHLHCIASKRFH